MNQAISCSSLWCYASNWVSPDLASLQYRSKEVKKEIMSDMDDAAANATNITSALNSVVTAIATNITNVTEGKVTR